MPAPRPSDPTGRHTRGRLLTTATVGLGAATAGVIGVPVAGYLLAPVTEEIAFHPVSLGPVSRFAAVGGGGFQPTAATFVSDPASPATGVELAYVHATGGSSPDWLAAEARFVVWSNRCTHVGCPVQATGIGFSCPCHGSQYDRRGQRIAGPAVRALDRFGWRIRDRELWLTARFSVMIDGDRVGYYPVKSPGQPLEVGGSRAVADALYPPVTYS